MTNPIAIIVPGKPATANKLYAPNRQGGLRKTNAYKAYLQLVAMHARPVVRRWCSGKPFLGECGIEIRVFFDSRRPDGDNMLKPTLDALAFSGVVKNDRQFTEYHLYKNLDREKPRIEISVWERENEPQ